MPNNQMGWRSSVQEAIGRSCLVGSEVKKGALILLGLWLASAGAFSAPLMVEDHNFALEIPANWEKIPAPSDQFQAAAHSQNDLKTVLVSAIQIPDNQISHAASDLIFAVQRSLRQGGWEVEAANRVIVNDNPFFVFSARQGTDLTRIYFTVAGDRAYVIHLINRSGDPDSDPELQSVLTSFRLLSPREFPAQIDPTPSFAYQLGHVIGQIFAYALLPAIAIGIGVWIIRRKRRHRRRRSRS